MPVRATRPKVNSAADFIPTHKTLPVLKEAFKSAKHVDFTGMQLRRF
jgi:hypothetical protein